MKFQKTLVVTLVAFASVSCGEGPKRITLPGAVKPGVAKEVSWQVGLTSINSGGTPIPTLLTQDGGALSVYVADYLATPTFQISRLRADLTRDEAFEKQATESLAKKGEKPIQRVLALRETADEYQILLGKLASGADQLSWLAFDKQGEAKAAEKLGDAAIDAIDVSASQVTWASVHGDFVHVDFFDWEKRIGVTSESAPLFCPGTEAKPTTFEIKDLTRSGNFVALLVLMQGCPSGNPWVLQTLEYAPNGGAAKLLQANTLNGEFGGNREFSMTADAQQRVWLALPQGDGVQGWMISRDGVVQRLDLAGGVDYTFATAYEISTLADGNVYFAARVTRKTVGLGYHALGLIAALDVDVNGAPTAKVTTYDHMKSGRDGERQAEAQSLLGVRDGVLYVGGFVLDGGQDTASVFTIKNLR